MSFDCRCFFKLLSLVLLAVFNFSVSPILNAHQLKLCKFEVIISTVLARIRGDVVLGHFDGLWILKQARN